MRRRLWVVTAALVAGVWIAPAASDRRRAAPTAAPAKPAVKPSGPSRAVKPATPARTPPPAAAAKRKQGAGTIYGGTGPKDADASVGRQDNYTSGKTNHRFTSTTSATGSGPDYSKGEGAGSGSGSGGGSGQSAGSGK